MKPPNLPVEMQMRLQNFLVTAMALIECGIYHGVYANRPGATVNRL